MVLNETSFANKHFVRTPTRSCCRRECGPEARPNQFLNSADQSRLYIQPQPLNNSGGFEFDYRQRQTRVIFTSRLSSSVFSYRNIVYIICILHRLMERSTSVFLWFLRFFVFSNCKSQSCSRAFVLSQFCVRHTSRFQQHPASDLEL